MIPIPFPRGRAPRLLAHYTNREGLVGILSSQELWASDIRFLNDSAEFEYARSLAQEVVAQRMQSESEPDAREVLSDIESFLRSFQQVPDTSVVSFSEVNDDLGQWRAYGGPSGGYALLFRPPLLRKILKKQRVHLVRCEYKPAQQKLLIHSVIDSLIKATKQRAASVRDVTHRITDGVVYSTIISVMAPSIKHPAFSAEREWRLITMPGEGQEPPRNVRARPSGLLPFQRIEVGLALTKALHSVVIGPMPEPGRERIAVDRLLAANNLAGVETVISHIPYRTW